MDELDEFLDSLETPTNLNGGTAAAVELDLEAEIDAIFEAEELPAGEAEDGDSDDEFTLDGVGSNLQKLGLQSSPGKKEEVTPVKDLVDKYNNPPKAAERQLLDKSQIPSSQKKDLIPALKERNDQFEIKSTEKSYDASNVGKIISSNAETSDADFLTWLSSSEEAGNHAETGKQDRGKATVTPGRERVTKSALDYIQNLSLEDSMGGRGTRADYSRGDCQSHAPSHWPFCGHQWQEDSRGRCSFCSIRSGSRGGNTCSGARAGALPGLNQAVLR